MMGSEQTQTKESKRAKTPEEAFDRQMLSGGYRMFLVTGLFFVVGQEVFVGLLPVPAVVGVAGLVGSLTAAFLAAPLFWELDGQGRTTRRIRRAVYFPIRKSAFIISKWKLMGMYGGVQWLFSLAVQLLFGPLFGFGNILLYQGTLAAIFVVNMIFFTIIGCVGAGTGE